MKTTPKTSGANFGKAILLVAFTMILGMGCQKEDEPTPSQNNSNSEKTTNANRAIADMHSDAINPIDNLLLPFNVIKIDHLAGNSKLPEYSVTVRSDLWVIYEGKKNVRVVDKISFRISDREMTKFINIFKANDFYNQSSDLDIAWGLPIVLTTFRPSQPNKPFTIYDDCYNNPEKLVLIRKSVEEVLGIDRFVNKEWTSEVQNPLF